jgi:DNA-binding CsgD family transcriptional regulator
MERYRMTKAHAGSEASRDRNSAKMHAALVGEIYDASLRHEQWTAILEKIGRLVDAPYGFVIVEDSDLQTAVSTPEFADILNRMLNECWLTHGPYPRTFSKRFAASFVPDEELMAIGELSEQAIFRDFFFPSGIGFGATTSFELPTGERITLGWRRRLGSEAFSSFDLELLDSLRSHLVRSLSILSKWQDRAISAYVSGLARFDLPALGIDTERKVVTTNTLMDSIIPLLSFPSERFTLRNSAADIELAAALVKYRKGDVKTEFTFPIRAASGKRFIARLLPPSSNGPFLRKLSVLVIVPVAPRRAPSEKLLQSLFDLTPTEAKVARALASGKSVSEIAESDAVSQGTVRTHVRGVLEKFGSNRQIDVIALLVGLPLSLVCRSADEGDRRE